MMNTANMSGYAAKTPGTLMLMCCLQNVSIRFSISSSNVALQARATLDVPMREISRPNNPADFQEVTEPNMTDFKYDSLDR